VYDWGFNRVVPNADGYALVDGTQGFADLLDQPPPGGGDDPDLRFFRWGRHADLVGRRVSDLTVVEPSALTYRLDPDGGYESSAPAQVDAYIAGSVSSAEIEDVAIAVNGRIGGWSELLGTSRGNRFWTVVPPSFLAGDGSDEIEVFVIGGTPEDPTLAPMSVR
jgi:hypothetical protein